MALYDYKCKDCDTIQTVSRSFAEPEKEYKCNTCNSILIRVYSNVGISFKGSGFYSKDK